MTAPDDDPQIPDELAEILRSLTGGAELPPEVVEMAQSMGIGQIDPTMLASAARQFQQMFSGPPPEGAFDVGQAREIARQAAAAGGDPSISDEERRATADAVGVAALWLDGVTDITVTGIRGVAWSRAEWVEATMPTWSSIVEPLAAGVGQAVGDALTAQLGELGELGGEGLPPGLAGMMGQASPFLARMQGMLFAAQLGQGVGALSADIVSGCEVSLPLVPAPTVALLPVTLRTLAEGLEVDEPQARLYVAVREAARVRLFGGVPWLGPALMAAVRDYAAGIHIDTASLEEAVRSIDPSDPASAQQAITSGLFNPASTPAQDAALLRLETLLALVEGWVDVVSDEATRDHLPSSGALAEAVRRRRAVGGPAEKTFESLVGLQMRPRRLRDAANLFRALEDAGGQSARDGAWSHPDLAPGSADLDDILGYVERAVNPSTDDFDAALDSLLRGDDERE